MGNKRYTPKFDGSEAKGYTGTPPVPGLYKGKINSIALGVIKSGKPENVGQDRLSIMVEITEGKYAGARILTGLNLVPDGAVGVNSFLYSLTDGSDEEKDAINIAFWKERKMLVSDTEDEYGNYPVLRIGKYIFSKGVTTAFETRMKPDREGNDRADVRRWVTPIDLEGEDEAEPDFDNDAEDADLDEGDAGAAVTVEYDAEGESEPETVEDDSDDDGDDPWGEDDD